MLSRYSLGTFLLVTGLASAARAEVSGLFVGVTPTSAWRIELAEADGKITGQLLILKSDRSTEKGVVEEAHKVFCAVVGEALAVRASENILGVDSLSGVYRSDKITLQLPQGSAILAKAGETEWTKTKADFERKWRRLALGDRWHRALTVYLRRLNASERQAPKTIQEASDRIKDDNARLPSLRNEESSLFSRLDDAENHLRDARQSLHDAEQRLEEAEKREREQKDDMSRMNVDSARSEVHSRREDERRLCEERDHVSDDLKSKHNDVDSCYHRIEDAQKEIETARETAADVAAIKALLRDSDIEAQLEMLKSGAPTYVAAMKGISIRRQPWKKSERFCVLAEDRDVLILPIKADWIPVCLTEGNVGWIHKSDLPSTEAPKAIVLGQ